VLKYYAYTGLLDYFTLELADERRHPRHFPPLGGQYMNDEWLVKRDALERNIGSTYFGIFDMDEYIIPSANRSLQTVLTGLLQTNPQASHFFFRNIHFLTNDKNDLENCSFFHRHLMTSPVRYNLIHKKMLLLTERIDTKTIYNHNVKPLNGFKEVTVLETEAYVNHYGICERKFELNVCKNKTGWIKDTSMMHWVDETINASIHNTLKLLSL